MGRHAKKRHVDEDASSGEEVAQPSKKVKTKTAAEANPGKDDEGNSFWPLSATRRVVIQNFKGKNYINLREYYSDASGDLRPGKKGIMLTLEQYNDFLTAIPAINAELRSKGHDVPDIFANAPSATAAASSSKSPSKEQKRKKKKMNIEATSDEEEADSE
ncbi:transcriptional Coactivator p15-domain-containing protein [Xylaria sp. FL1042]|nr:transcriptional Coactivator p15-domain-containing protein [Xylaria sp. FL1042]